MSQQVAVVAGDSAQQLSIKMIKDKFHPMYGSGTNYTAKVESQITNFGVSVENELTSKLGADMHTVMR